MDPIIALALVVLAIIFVAAFAGVIILAIDILHTITHPDHRSFSQRLKDRRHIESIYD